MSKCQYSMKKSTLGDDLSISKCLRLPADLTITPPKGQPGVQLVNTLSISRIARRDPTWRTRNATRRAHLWIRYHCKRYLILQAELGPPTSTDAMVAHTEPVRSWGRRPCGEIGSPTTTCVWAGCGAPRPPGTGRGMPEVNSLRNSVLNRAYGRRPLDVGVADRRTTNEQRPSHAASSSTPEAFAVAPSDEGCHCDWSGCGLRGSHFPRLNDDLGIAAQ